MLLSLSDYNTLTLTERGMFVVCNQTQFQWYSLTGELMMDVPLENVRPDDGADSPSLSTNGVFSSGRSIVAAEDEIAML